jgi:hypothetical protein
LWPESVLAKSDPGKNAKNGVAAGSIRATRGAAAVAAT